MLLTHFIWQTVLKPLSGTNAKNGAITPSLTPTIHTIHARCYKASECGEGGGGGGTNRQGNKCVCGWGGAGGGEGVGGNRTMRIQGDGHQHNHLRRLACLLACYNGPAFTRLSLCRGSLGVVLGDLVDVAAWGIVPCVSKIDTLGGGAWGGVGGGVVLLVTTAD